ncbi:MAG: hypothetical protein LBC38_05530 [Oscillospiraceae bacterium]|jgi:hypothetical protein|nr:hypothetical protein [Oscillospiraceae bacterium]
MKYKISLLAAGVSAAVVLFVFAFISAELHFVRSAERGFGADESAYYEEAAVTAFAPAVNEQGDSEVYTVMLKGKSIIVYSADDTVFMTAPIPENLPQDDKNTLSNGMTLLSREELLLFMEDFSE